MNNLVVWQLIFRLVFSDFPPLCRMDGLRQKLESQGLKDVIYMVINHQGVQAQRLHSMLQQRLSENITLYKQLEQQPDVWQILNGEKDDFLIYDRFVTCSAWSSIYFSFSYFCTLDFLLKSQLHFILNLTMLFCPFTFRCGRLTHHISLPYSIIGQGHVESAIKDTYCKRLCGNCAHEV